MDYKQIYDDFLNNHPYKKMSNFNPIKPLMIWGQTNRDLNDFYNRPEINLTDSKDDLNVKNTMRHIVGLANTMQEYKNPKISKTFGFIKEFADVLRGDLDNKLDWGNNEIGINYASQYPNFTKDNILNFAYNQAMQNYEKDYGYKYPKAIKNVYAEIYPKN